MTERSLVYRKQSSSQPNQSNSSQMMYLPNKIKVRAQNAKTLYVPIYIRGCIKQIIKVSLQHDQVKVRIELYVTFKTHITEEVWTDLNSNELKSKDQLGYFLKNNLTLQIGGNYVDIINIQNEMVYHGNQQLLKSNFKSKSSTHFISNKKQNKNQDLQQPFHQQFIVNKQTIKNQQEYSTFVIKGVFNCDNQTKNIYFPYHQILSSFDIKVHTLYFSDVVICYNIMTLNQSDFDCAQHFNFQFDQVNHSKFGIYNVNQNVYTLQWNNFIQEDADNQKELTEQNLILVRSLTFKFNIYCYNIPFFFRYQYPLWLLNVVSMMLYFTSISNIANVFANIILISVAEITLLSNFRKGIYSTQNISFYQIKLFGFILILFMLFIHQTKDYYNGQRNLKHQNYKSYYFFASIIMTAFFGIMNIILYLFIGLKIKYYAWNDQAKKIMYSGWLWNQEILQNCGSFENKEGLLSKNEKKMKSNILFQNQA